MTREILETKADLSDLPYASDASFQTLKQCRPGTREDVLTDVTRWIDDPDPNAKRLLVLTGDARIGKSAIAHTIAFRYHELGRLASSIFANCEDVASWDHLSGIILPTIARDLADLDPLYRNRLWDNIHARRAVRKTRDVVTQFDTFILVPSQELAIAGPIVIVIDGIRSSESQNLHHFLAILAKRAQELPSNFRILLTTKTSNSILTHFVQNQSARVVRIREMKNSRSSSYDDNTRPPTIHRISSGIGKALKNLTL